ncbi:MAG: hypothetical protein LBL58_17065, partial [Tannerellaceae bacterium]|nr:hypothetical protein [Tannerellaceae bacterium]
EIDYSCDNIIYEYQSDSTLVVTSDRPEYPSGTFRYIPDPTCNFGYSHPYHLTIDGVPVYSNGVLEKIMFFGDSLQNESIIFVRIK